MAAADASFPSDDSSGQTAAAIAGRLFVVGCARSGTALLESFLAAHPAVLSFPETAVFARLLAGRQEGRSGPALPELRLQAGRARVTALLDALQRPDLEGLMPGPDASVAAIARGFVAVLDRMALDQGKRWWVEKTPGNLAVVREIAHLVPGAKFISILRDGRQNVASLHDMALRYPDTWWALFRDLDRAIERWNTALRQTRRLRDVPEVLLVRYERLISETEAVVEEMCRFTGLPFSREMIDRRAEAARTVVATGAPWEAEALAEMRPAAEDKFNKLFSAEQKAYIESRLERIDF
jgi:hypothetical protein